uniref:Uncharacterized protein n=1 Tax=Romanomermis culicivorax TaxID=13658 RepID=A0A915IKW7_ROMCU
MAKEDYKFSGAGHLKVHHGQANVNFLRIDACPCHHLFFIMPVTPKASLLSQGLNTANHLVEDF